MPPVSLAACQGSEPGLEPRRDTTVFGELIGEPIVITVVSLDHTRRLA